MPVSVEDDCVKRHPIAIAVAALGRVVLAGSAAIVDVSSTVTRDHEADAEEGEAVSAVVSVSATEA
jgi:hypothetical protein